MRPLPETTDLPDAATTAETRVGRAAAAAETLRLAAAGVDTDAVRAQLRPGLAELLEDLHDAVSWVRRREGSWTDRLGRMLLDAHWGRVWADHVAATERLLAELADLTSMLAGHRVAVPESLAAEPKRLLGQLGEVRERFAAGRGLSWLMQPGLYKLADDVRVDGEPLRTTEDVDIAAAWVRRAQARQRLGDHWSEWIQRLAIPAPGASAGSASAVRRGPGVGAAGGWRDPSTDVDPAGVGDGRVAGGSSTAGIGPAAWSGPARTARGAGARRGPAGRRREPARRLPRGF
jgi:hypothetical protein